MSSFLKNSYRFSPSCLRHTDNAVLDSISYTIAFVPNLVVIKYKLNKLEHSRKENLHLSKNDSRGTYF